MTILTHPEHALHAAVSGLVIFLFVGRSKKGIANTVVISLLALLFSAPWWSIVLKTNGITPFLNAANTGNYNFQAIINFITFNLSHEIGLRSIGFMSLVGALILISRKQYFLPTWIGAIYISEPRSAPLFLVPAFAICSSLALVEILKILSTSYSQKNSKTIPKNESGLTLFHRLAKITIGILVVQWLISSYSIAMVEATTTTLRKEERDAFAWVSNNTLPGSTFIILTGDQPFTDPTSEWFPALTNRISINTVQGNEWNSSVNFYDFFALSKEVQSCYYLDIKCLEHWSVENGISFDYIYIRNLITVSNKPEMIGIGIISNLLYSGSYEPVYVSTDVAIFQVLKGN